ncbi:DUF6302 family protein [Streptomyces sp. NPDC093509]|uniref:DUF6302 family protein n=1 Tax=Streptomyces sp. NPDC093509 TaxID=3154982 RepID=UPI00344D5A87
MSKQTPWIPLLPLHTRMQVGGTAPLAMPTGSSRNGGYPSASSVEAGMRVRAASPGKSGVPRIRLGLPGHPDTCHTVDSVPRQPWDDAERGRYFAYAPSTLVTFFSRVSMSDQLPESTKNEPEPAPVRNWQQDPLLSTLRDVGGCLAVILIGVLITVLVSAARDTWTLLGNAPAHLVIDRASPDLQR